MAAGISYAYEQVNYFLKQCWMPLLIVCGLTALITLGVHTSMKWTVKTTIKAKAQDAALAWASHFNAEFTELSAIVERGALSEGQQEVVRAAIKFSEVHSFTVFDMTGALIYSTDYGVVLSPSERSESAFANKVLNSETPIIEIINRTDPNGDQSVYVQAYVPAVGIDGTTIGVIGLFLDKSESAAVYTRVMTAFGWVLPALCALLYAIPSLAYVMKREQAHARTRRVALLSRFDQLTGALNRHTMTQESRKMFVDRGNLELVGVFFLDIDKFKTVNDEYGHEYGDAYLQFISSVILSNLRPDDLVGRMGGDEFVMTLRRVNLQTMQEIGKRILLDAREPFEYKGRTMQTSVSIGYYLAERSVSRQDALHAADLALYHAKAIGRNTMVEYFPELDTAMIRRREIERRMRDAIKNDQFQVVFQPITTPKENAIVGFEALLRLDGQDGTPISPTEFIPIAEESGLIQQIGIFILRDAVTNAKTWPDHVFVSVNLSPAQFKQGDLVKNVADILRELEFPAHRLEFEVTEGLLMGDEQRVSDQLIGLKQMGISIAMDDFGTGYSSLGYLWKYNFDKLKIDRVFLEGLDFDRERYRQIIETIVILGHQMGMTVTLEGVETAHHHEMLRELACDQFQGFYFGKPMTAKQALQVLSGAKDTDVTEQPLFQFSCGLGGFSRQASTIFA
ncbi:MAG: EAL domain-containing protein [Paracoccaceae bacterium]|nr:EAL domain-containing protein [Paracoccaceae bacterium]